MNRTRRLLAAALCAAGIAAPAVLADTASAASCAKNRVCLFDGGKYNGATKAVGCSALKPTVPLKGFYNRTSSVINKCPFPIYMWGDWVGRGGGFQSRYVGPNQWRTLGGKTAMDNRALWVSRKAKRR